LTIFAGRAVKSDGACFVTWRRSSRIAPAITRYALLADSADAFAINAYL